VPTVIRPISYTYVDLVKRVAMGLSIEDGEEMARGLYCLRPHEKFRTHLLGSAWLCYYVMLAWFWAPMVVEVALEQQPDQQRIADYELTLQAGVRALNIWKVCDRNAGIVHALARRAALAIGVSEDGSGSCHWRQVAAALFLLACLHDAWHGYPVAIGFATFVNFYINPAATGANDLNTGTTTAAPTHTYGGGTYVRSTNTYTVASGNPSTDGFVSVGDYVSIYTTSGRTVATFIIEVSSLTSTTIVGTSGTHRYGVDTSVSEAANASSLTIGGSWASPLPLGSTLTAGGLGAVTVPLSTKVNVKQATYTMAANMTSPVAGATTAPLWVSGYSASPGDLDADTTNSLSKPVLAFNSGFGLTTSAAHQFWSSVTVTGVFASIQWLGSGAPNRYVRIRVTNTSSNAAAEAFRLSGVGTTLAYCYLKVPSTATTVGVSLITTSNTMSLGTVFDTGGLGGLNGNGNQYMVQQCVFLTNTGAGILNSTDNCRIFGSTFYGATVDGIKWTGTPTSSSVVGCLFSGLNGSTATTNGINNASGTNTNLIFRACNDYYNVSNPEVGMGDSFAFFPQTDSNPVVTSATDMTPVAGSNALTHGFPGIFENETFSSYQNIGAVQQIPASGGGAAIFGG
jgi:hypothetical protein